MNPHITPAPPAAEALFERRFVLFAAPATGPDWPYIHRLYHAGEVRSVCLDWPDWLPHLDVKALVPLFAGVHTRWPLRVVNSDRAVPGAKIAAIFTDDTRTHTAIRRAYWVDVSEPWHAALAAYKEALANPSEPVPEPTGLAGVVEKIARAARRGAKPAAEAA